MSVLQVTGLKKILGAQEILRGVDLRVEQGEKVGIVGRNGEGKTTLLRLIEGEEPIDGGTVQLAKGARIGYVVQRPAFETDVTVRGYVESGMAEVHRVERELERAGERMAEAEGDELDRLVRLHGELTARMEFLGGWESDRRVETVMDGIGLTPSLWEREASTLSGGEKSRTAMAKELVSIPDLLLLDEPTNHLDLAGIEWLEDYLKNIHSAILMVSHDRRLLNHVTETIVEVERGGLTRYGGNYSRYVTQKEERYESAYRNWAQQQDLIRKEEAFIKKHMGSQRTAEAKGRLKKLQHVVRLEQPYNDVRKPKLKLPKVERGGEQVLNTEALSIGYDEPLLEDIDLRIGRGERIGLIGPNGTGKTTLLKILAGRIRPLSGEIKMGYKAACGYFDQETSDLRDDGTPFSEIRRDHPKMTDLEVRSHLALFLFRGSDVDLEVSGLSGGERARLSLARLVLTGCSWLALDEPTNHLDLPGRTALEEMLSAFPGALVCISHDREFLDRLCNKLFIVKNGTVESFNGNYSEYREKERAAEMQATETATRTRKVKAKQERQQAAAKEAKQKKKKGASGNSANGSKKGKQDGGGKAKPKNPWAFKKLEEAIMALETQREGLLGELASEEVYRNPDSMREKQFELAEVERDLDEKNREWEEWA